MGASPSSPYSIRKAQPRDLPALAAIELEAAKLLRGHAPESVLNEATDDVTFRNAQAEGRLWVGVAGDVPVGFAHVETLPDGLPHLEEIDVHPAHGRRGVGTGLVRAVCAWATEQGHPEITLTTFRALPWNMRFYARMGFEEIPPSALRPALATVVREETVRGLDPRARLVMRYRCAPGRRAALSTVETHQLLLRAPEPTDIDSLFEIQGDAEAMHYTYVAPDRDATAAHVQAHAARFGEDGFAPWTAVLKSEQRIVGWGGLNRDPRAPDWGPEVAYFFHRGYWGRGLATELVRAALHLAFQELRLPEVLAFTRPDNLPSQRVLAKTGFAFVRYVPELERDQYSLERSVWNQEIRR